MHILAQRREKEAGTTQKTNQKTTQKGSLESALKSSLKSLAMIKENPSITTDGMADLTGLARRSVTKQLTKLKKDGLIRRVGPDKGGHWELLNK